MRTTPKNQLSAFTIIELMIAIMIGMAVGAMVISLFNQQLAFLKIYHTQDFLAREAPIVSMHVSKIIGKANGFRLHDNLNDALSGTNPRIAPSPVVVLNFDQPDGSKRAAILAFEKKENKPALYYYIVPIQGAISSPDWFITNQAKKIEFSLTQGVLRMTLEGASGESITYSGSMQQ